MRDYRALLDTFPESPFARSARLRLALGLQDTQQAGEAIVELTKLIKTHSRSGSAHLKNEEEPARRTAEEAEEESAEDEEPYIRTTAERRRSDESSAEPAQVRQVIDTLLNFAPLPQLEAPLRNPKLNELLRFANQSRARAALSGARRFLQRTQIHDTSGMGSPRRWTRETDERTRRVAKRRRARAQKLLALGDAWAAARKQLLNAPLDATEPREEIFASDHVEAGLLRRENAKALLSAAASDEELESREELRHATNTGSSG